MLGIAILACLVAVSIWISRELLGILTGPVRRKGTTGACRLPSPEIRGEIREMRTVNYAGDSGVVCVFGDLELLMPDGTWTPVTQARWDVAAREWVSLEKRR